MEVKKSRRNVSIEEFIQFFAEKVKKEENVQFIKGTSKPESDKGAVPKNKLKMYQSKIKPQSNNFGNSSRPKTNYRPSND